MYENNKFSADECPITHCTKTKRPPFSRRHFKIGFSLLKLYHFRLISLKFVPRGAINNIPALVQIMAWRRPSDRPLSESLMVSLPTHICVARPQWVITVTPQWARWRLKSPPYRLFTQPFVKAHNKESIKTPRHWPWWVELTGDRWIPRTKGQ